MHELEQQIVRRGLCTMCGLCAAACPPRCIAMRRSPDGRLLPSVSGEECTHCGLCIAICPGGEVPFATLAQAAATGKPSDPLLGQFARCCTGSATDPAVRAASSSGGVVSAVLIHALDHGLIRSAVLARMAPARPLETQSCVVSTADEVRACAGSKYVPVALDAVAAAVRGDGPFAVVGLPCHIHALRKWGAARPALGRRMLLIGLMCGFGKTYRVLDRAVRRAGFRREEVSRVIFRSGGWPGCLRLDCNDGRFREFPFREWFQRDLSPMRCTLCIDGAAELADISCGDAWLPEFMGRDEGVSMVVARTAKGLQDLESAGRAGALRLDDVPAETVVRSQAAMLRRKKRQFRAHALLARLAGGGVPRYGVELPAPSLRDGLLAAVTRIRIAASGTPLGTLLLDLRRSVGRFARPVRRVP